MRLILSSMAQAVDAQLSNSDLTNAQWLPILKLHQGQASTVAELARACTMDAGAMTRLLDRLEAKGLCKRQRSDTDRRVVNISLTNTGHEVARGIPSVLCDVLNQHLTGLSPDEFSTLKDLLNRVLANTSEAAAAHSISACLATADACNASPVSISFPTPSGAPDAI
jgi:DNA-binding MarR family transcriptional regulator